MYLVFDGTTATYIGPFDTDEEARFFIDEMDFSLPGGSGGMEIEELVHPQEFVLDNAFEEAMAK